jgi:hypothetical protein
VTARPQGVLPEVLGLPSGDLTKQVGLCLATQRRRSQDSKLKLPVFPAAERALRQEPLRHPFQRERVGAAGPTPLQRVGGDLKEDLAGEGAAARMQRR